MTNVGYTVVIFILNNLFYMKYNSKASLYNEIKKERVIFKMNLLFFKKYDIINI